MVEYIGTFIPDNYLNVVEILTTTEFLSWSWSVPLAFLVGPTSKTNFHGAQFKGLLATNILRVLLIQNTEWFENEQQIKGIF